MRRTVVVGVDDDVLSFRVSVSVSEHVNDYD
jgi:hypothetical protein